MSKLSYPEDIGRQVYIIKGGKVHEARIHEFIIRVITPTETELFLSPEDVFNSLEDLTKVKVSDSS